MAATLGLRWALTVYGMIDLVVPYLLGRELNARRLSFNRRVGDMLLRTRFTRSRGRFLLRRLKHGIINTVRPPKSPLLSLPYEIREQIYRAMCTSESDGRVIGLMNLLLIDKQIYLETLPIIDQIEHVIRMGDLQGYEVSDVEFMGLPKILKLEKSFDWHMASLKHLVLEVAICGIGSMTPDCFDVNISHNAKDQWRNLKRLIGIWPEIREEPLTSIRIDLRMSECSSKCKTYRADFIRVIRNFKRTKVWAETGDCAVHRGNRSLLLPLARAFNQGRRNWVKQSNVGNNLIVNYDSQVLKNHAAEAGSEGDQAEKFKKQRAKWSVMPTADTSRSNSAVWPEWTGKEEKYIEDKMLQRTRDCDDEYECRECLAVFDKPRDLRQHIARGRQRVESKQSPSTEVKWS
ncbi:hypothetical protein LTR64_005985 [Lithohypha guttulata]|uniref:uncharacterized protein n=1 Tax=Lithohypha guttulata TaxID=1690604 RepID=UPI002DDFA9E5|nr:hypothetical protein LTR51_002217 [Lithohypha guttulata]